MALESILLSVGYPMVFLLIMGESAGVPLPGETAVLIAGGAAGAGKGFNIWLVFTCAAAGAIVGDTIGYWIGRKGGRALLTKLSGKLWFKPDHIEKAERFFARHGGKAVFFGRSVSYLRVFTALMAGVSHMYYPRFLLYNALGGIVWAGLVSFLGYKFGQHLDVVERIIKDIGWGLGVAIVIVIAVAVCAKKFGWIAAIRARFGKKGTSHDA
jgi:membrane protein DedA with SNARE-associated domain